MQRSSARVVLSINIRHRSSLHKLFKDSGDVGGGGSGRQVKERFPVGIMRSGRVVIAVSKKKADIGKGAMIDGEHQWAGVRRGGGEARVLEFEEKGGVC